MWHIWGRANVVIVESKTFKIWEEKRSSKEILTYCPKSQHRCPWLSDEASSHWATPSRTFPYHRKWWKNVWCATEEIADHQRTPLVDLPSLCPLDALFVLTYIAQSLVLCNDVLPPIRDRRDLLVALFSCFVMLGFSAHSRVLIAYDDLPFLFG